jgi:hypothetical protein
MDRGANHPLNQKSWKEKIKNCTFDINILLAYLSYFSAAINIHSFLFYFIFLPLFLYLIFTFLVLTIVLHPVSYKILQEKIYPERSFSRELWCENLIRSFTFKIGFRGRGGDGGIGEMVLLFCSGQTYENSVLGSKGNRNI